MRAAEAVKAKQANRGREWFGVKVRTISVARAERDARGVLWGW